MSCRISPPKSEWNCGINTCLAIPRPTRSATESTAMWKSSWYSHARCRCCALSGGWATMRRINNAVAAGLAGAVLLAGWALHGQPANPPSSQAESFVFRSDTRVVVCNTTVFDKNGHLVTDLARDAFTVTENGAAQRITEFRREDVPVSLGLIVDNSGSMRIKRAGVEAASLALVKDSNPQDEVFVVNFNDEAFLDLPNRKDFTNDIREMEEALTRIDARGGTYSGARPNVSGYNPMHKEGAIILGIGGDNSKGSAGTFYEGVMTSGYPSAATENAVQANITSVGYAPYTGSGTGATGPIVAGVDSADCVDLANASATDGNHVQLYTCNGVAAAQSWTVASNGTLTIDGGCMDITGANYSNGTKIEWGTCNGGAHQQWTAVNGALENPAAGKCLEPPAAR